MKKITPLLVILFPVLVLLWAIGWTLFTAFSQPRRRKAQEIRKTDENLEIIVPERYEQVAISEAE